MSGSQTLAPSSATPTKRPRRNSPNQRRVIGRTIMWTVLMGAAAVWLPHTWL